MCTDPRYSEWSIRLLYFLAGIASTIVGSWIASKIRVYHDNRKLHLEHSKEKVLSPLREGLHTDYEPLLASSSSLISVDWRRREIRSDVRAEENPEEWGPKLLVADPRTQVEGRIDEVLLEDAKENHYPRHVESWERLRDSWTAHARQCEEWVTRISNQILEETGLAAHPVSREESYVMHLQLAVFVYARLFQLGHTILHKEKEGSAWLLSDGARRVARGTGGQIDYVLRILDSLIESERNAAIELRQESDKLLQDLRDLSRRINFALAQQHLPHRCPLVKFF